MKEGLLDSIKFNENDLVPVITQQHDTGEVLMLAWMNRDAIRETLATQSLCYFSRSQGKLWRKGEQAGHFKYLVDLRLDCDRDTFLALVEQKGVACHTGRRSCFFMSVKEDSVTETREVLRAPETLYD